MPIMRNPWGGSYYVPDPPGTTPPTPIFGDPATYGAAVKTQGSDYDKIMQQYEDLIKSYSSESLSPKTTSFNPTNFNPINFSSVTPQLSPYSQSSDVTKSLAGLSELLKTGGYFDANIADIRERSVSPIRSIYASGKQNVERQRSLSGGYSPNFNAVSAQMAREEADKIGDVTTNVNADIAQKVASNKLSAAPAYASASGAANAARTAANQRNAEIINQINQFNSQGALNANQFNSQGQLSTEQFNSQGRLNAEQFNIQTALEAAKARMSGIGSAIQGKTSLYGTNPALIKTFGEQASEAARLGQGQQQLNNQRYRTVFGV